MKKYLFVIFSLILGIIIIFWLCLRTGFGRIFQEISYLKFWQIFIIFFISWFTFFLTTLRIRLILQNFCHEKIPIRSVLKAKLAEAALCYFTPIVYTGGEIFRLIILKRDKNIPFSDSFSALLAERFGDLAALIIFLLSGGIFLFFIQEGGLGIVYLGLALLLLIFTVIAMKILGLKRVILFLVRLFKLDRIKYLSGRNRDVSPGIRLQSSLEKSFLYLRDKTKNFILNTLLSLSILFLWTWQVKLLINFMGENIGFFKIYFIKILILISGFTPVIARIGTLEAAYLGGGTMFGLSGHLSLACALVMRIVELSIIGFGVIIGLQYLGDLFLNVAKIFFVKNNTNSKPCPPALKRLASGEKNS